MNLLCVDKKTRKIVSMITSRCERSATLPGVNVSRHLLLKLVPTGHSANKLEVQLPQAEIILSFWKNEM